MSTEDTSLVVPYYKPSEIISILRDLLSKQNTSARIVSLNGVYIKTPNATLYKNCAYDVLRDENTDEEISLLIHRNLRDDLNSGNIITVIGTIDRNINSKGHIQIVLKVTRVEVVKEQVLSEKEVKQIECRNRKAQTGFKNVDAILENKLFQGQKPTVALLFAGSSITDADFKKGVEAAATHITFTEFKVSFANSDELIKMLRYLEVLQYDVIAIIRGGGSGIERLDDIEVVEALTNLKTAWIYGVGHEKENLFIRNIADKVIPIPFAVGNYFRDMVNTVIEKKTKSRAALVEEVKKQYIKQIEEANKQNTALQSKLNSMQKSLDEFTKTNTRMINENNNLNTTIRKLTNDLADARNYTKELERQLKAKNKGCMGCLGMIVAIISVISFACFLVTIII